MMAAAAASSHCRPSPFRRGRSRCCPRSARAAAAASAAAEATWRAGTKEVSSGCGSYLRERTGIAGGAAAGGGDGPSKP